MPYTGNYHLSNCVGKICYDSWLLKSEFSRNLTISLIHKCCLLCVIFRSPWMFLRLIMGLKLLTLFGRFCRISEGRYWYWFSPRGSQTVVNLLPKSMQKTSFRIVSGISISEKIEQIFFLYVLFWLIRFCYKLWVFYSLALSLIL